VNIADSAHPDAIAALLTATGPSPGASASSGAAPSAGAGTGAGAGAGPGASTGSGASTGGDTVAPTVGPTAPAIGPTIACKRTRVLHAPSIALGMVMAPQPSAPPLAGPVSRSSPDLEVCVFKGQEIRGWCIVLVESSRRRWGLWGGAVVGWGGVVAGGGEGEGRRWGGAKGCDFVRCPSLVA
jgi:hypothetical protein